MKNQNKIWDEEYKRNPRKWNKETKFLPNIIKGKSVLELGVGNGKTLISILRQKPKNIVALDFSLEAVKLSQEYFSNYPNVEIVHADITSIPCNDSSFDVIVCHYILNNLLEKDRIKAIKEILRVLKPKGKVIFEDFSIGDFRQTSKSQDTIKSNGIYCHFFSLDELKLLFKDFKSVKLEEKTSNPLTNKPSIIRKTLSGIIEK